jgi:DNA polymerase
MRGKILAVVEELKRRKAEGENFVLVDGASVEALRGAVLPREESHAAPVAEVVRTPAPKAREVPPAPAPKAAAPRVLAPEESYAAPKPREVPRAAASVVVSPSSDIPPPPSFTLPEGTKKERWDWLRQKVLSCPVCTAHLNPGKQIVFGVGNIDASIFFCGEAPGADEEEQGIPFVGRAGQLLEKIIAAMGLSRGEVYIGNIMNWRPQTGSEVGNRPPSEEEMAFCLPYLRAQLAVVQPKVIVALGNTALKGLLGKGAPGVTSARGRWFEFGGVPLMPTFHPSYVLRYGTPETKRQIWEDMMSAMEKVGMPVSEKQRGFFLPKA